MEFGLTIGYNTRRGSDGYTLVGSGESVVACFEQLRVDFMRLDLILEKGNGWA